MTADKLPQGLKNKISFVDGLSKAVSGKVSSIESLNYVLAYRVIGNTECCAREYLVVNYKGGAVQARNCSCNSNAAILEELAKMVYSSQVYPEDTRDFDELTQDDRYDLFDIESI
jgi:hypothetical protein